METPALQRVPFRKLWQWSKILVLRVDKKKNLPRVRAMGHWVGLAVVFRPITSDNTTICSVVSAPGRLTPYGSAGLVAALLVAMGGVVWWMPIHALLLGVLVSLVGLLALRLGIHLALTWRFRADGMVDWIGNVVADPESPNWSGLRLGRQLCQWADVRVRTLVGKTIKDDQARNKEARARIKFFEMLGACRVGEPSRKYQLMRRCPKTR